MCSPEENQIAALTEELAFEKNLSELRRHALECILSMYPNPKPPHDDRICPPRDLKMALVAWAGLSGKGDTPND